MDYSELNWRYQIRRRVACNALVHLEMSYLVLRYTSLRIAVCRIRGQRDSCICSRGGCLVGTFASQTSELSSVEDSGGQRCSI